MSDTKSAPVELRLDDAGVSCCFALPDGWPSQRHSVAVAALPTDAEGRLPVWLTASSADGQLRLQLSATRMRLPLGLMPAVVYWAGLYGLDPIPEDEAPWGGFEALSGWSTSTDRLTAAAWVQIQDSIVELRLDGPSVERERMQAAWALVHEGFRCEPLASDPPLEDESETWSTRVQTLRAEGRLEEAIDVAERDGDRAEVLLVQADLHAERMRRASAEQRHDVAREAWRQAVECLHAYAASATSGGEGAARSRERDRVLAELGPEPS